MKDTLRELLGELMSACEMIGYATSGNERANHRATIDKLKAELLSILDAEGDGGAVGEAQIMAEWFKADGSVHGPNVETVTMPQAKYLAFRRSLNHPALSGVVRDEDVCSAVDVYNSEMGGIDCDLPKDIRDADGG